MKTYLEFSENNTHKFYEITVDDATIIIRYGRIGETGISSSKLFLTPDKAQAEATKKIREKTKSGYVEAIQGEREKRTVSRPEEILLELATDDEDDGAFTWTAYLETKNMGKISISTGYIAKKELSMVRAVAQDFLKKEDQI
jgi:predicted DNA-binding WGR domain protein